MPDRGQRGPGDPGDGSEYGWLYGAKRPGSQSGGGSASDPEPTRMLPKMSRPERRDGPRETPREPARDPGPRRPAPAPTPVRERGVRRRRPVLKIVLVLLVAWLAFLIAVPLWAWTRIEKVDAEPSGARPDDQPGTTYLLVGSDSRKGLSKKENKRLGTGGVGDVGQRTDTIMLLHTGDGPSMLLSIPRDSIVPVPGHGTTKINAAFSYGGPKLLVQTIEQATGVRIDHYVEIGFGGFVNSVQAVGGITICPSQRMVDPRANLNIKKGCQEADGVVALGYARSRHTSGLGDLDRAKHQREVVSAVGHEVVSPWTFINPVRYWNVVMAMPDSFAFGEGTNPLRAAMWASAMTHVTGDKGLTCGVPIQDLVVNWDPERSKQMFEYVKDDKTDDIPKSLCTPTGLPKSVTG